MNIYYKIWIDSIYKIRSMPDYKYYWTSITMIYMSMAMAMNFVMLIVFLQENILNFWFYNLKVNIFPGTKLNYATNFFILYLLPMLLLNYFLIFRNNRYEILLKKYKSNNGKLFLSYFFTTLGLVMLSLVIIMIVQ